MHKRTPTVCRLLLDEEQKIFQPFLPLASLGFPMGGFRARVFVDAAQTLVNPTGTPSGGNTQETGVAEDTSCARASAGKAGFTEGFEVGNDFSRMLNEVWRLFCLKGIGFH